MIEPKTLLRAMFEAAVAAADPMRVVPAALPPKPAGRVVVVGAGKASARMAEAVEAAWGPCEGLVITRYGYARACQGIEVVEAAHPVPDAAGVAATQRMLDLLAGLGAEDFVLCLISGGGSALLCAPAGGITLAEKQAINAALLASGAPIDQMNILRKHLSAVKGGQLAAAAFPARMLTLMISDVPGDDPAFIASGPTVGDRRGIAAARAIVERYGLDLPPAAQAILAGRSRVLDPDDRRLEAMETRIIAAPAQSLAAAAQVARRHGVDVHLLGDALEGEARDLGAAQAGMALDFQVTREVGDPPIVLLSGGECTVTRRVEAPGVGGPNAEFTLAAMLALNGAPGVYVMACDTDGVDGGAEVAGAMIGPDDLARARAAGAIPEQALLDQDSHGFFETLGAQIVTGPTLTNVNDFRALFIA